MNRTIITIALLSAISASAQTITVTPGIQTYGYRSWNITVQPAPQPQTQYWTQPAPQPQPQIVMPSQPSAPAPQAEAPTTGCAPNCDFSLIPMWRNPEVAPACYRYITDDEKFEFWRAQARYEARGPKDIPKPEICQTRK